MALLDISEYPRMQTPNIGQAVPVGLEPALAFQQITFTTATASAAFGASTRLVRIVADGICRVRFSTAGTAVTAATGFRMNLGVPEYFNVSPGDKLSVITAS